MSSSFRYLHLNESKRRRDIILVLYTLRERITAGRSSTEAAKPPESSFQVELRSTEQTKSDIMSYSEYLYGRGQEITRSINQDLYALSSMSTPAKLGVVGAGLAILLAIKLISAAFHRPLSSKSSIPTKAQRSQAMKREFNSVEKGNESVQNLADVSPRNL